MTDPLAEQLAGILHDRAWTLTVLLGTDLHEPLARRIHERAPWLAAQLTSGDDREAAQTVIDLAAAGVIPDDPRGDWWATPLGRAVAASVGHPTAEHVSYSVAAAMLGVTRSRVGQLVADGKLERHPDGGVTVTSIRQRLASS